MINDMKNLPEKGEVCRCKGKTPQTLEIDICTVIDCVEVNFNMLLLLSNLYIPISKY